MEEAMQFCNLDGVSPEGVFHVYDPETQMRGVVVIDTFLWGVAGGGTRWAPDITTAEICGLARTMTYKFAMLDVPVGGAKLGIWADVTVNPNQRAAQMRAFGRAIRPLMLEGRLSIGLDIGTSHLDLEEMYCGAKLSSPLTGLVATEIRAERVENLSTGYGAVVAAKAACEFAGFSLEGASVALEGFGKAGRSAAHYLIEEGATIVAMSTIHGALYQRDGLDFDRLLRLYEEFGDNLVDHYSNAQRLRREDLYALPVDVLIPGARPNVIDKANVGSVQAKVISSTANNPVTPEAGAELFARNTVVVPDFISNAGGAVAVIVDWTGASVDTLFHCISHEIGALSRGVLEASASQGVDPMSVAVAQATKKVRDMIRAREELSFEQIRDRVSARFFQTNDQVKSSSKIESLV